MVDGVPAHGVLGSAYSHGALSGKSQLPLAMQGFKQDLTSLNLAPTDLWRGKISIHEDATLDDKDSTMIIKEDFAFIIREHRARAEMARPSETGPMVTQLKDKSVIVMDCGASRTVTGSLLNTREVTEKTV